LVKRATKGDRTAMSELKELIGGQPAFWEEVGNLAIQAERSLVSVAAGDNLLLEEALYQKLEAIRTELAGPAPTPLERLLVERVVACWLQIYYADAVYAQGMNNSMSFEAGDYYQRRQDRGHHRYISAIRALAQVRRLLIPAVQVNVGGQQVNVA